jgi:hypothetical protein
MSGTKEGLSNSILLGFLYEMKGNRWGPFVIWWKSHDYKNE